MSTGPDRLREECGVIGVFGAKEAAELCYLGLYALQHRGQESAGIACSDGGRMASHVGMGLVGNVFDEKSLGNLNGHLAIGHNRYSTTGRVSLLNAQPIVVDCKAGRLAIAHNGNITNAVELRDAMEAEGHIFQSTSDSELVLHRIARSRKEDLRGMIAEAVDGQRGAVSLLIRAKDCLYAYRDPQGFRPLCIGRQGESWMIASESCAFDIAKGRYLRDVVPGELIMVDGKGLHSTMVKTSPEMSRCIFEFVYFARPDSIVFEENVDKVRRKLGKQLAKESPVDADFVISVPDSSNSAALGYSLESGTRFEFGLIRNHYVGRTFISPKQSVRDSGVLIKYNPVRGVLRGKRIVVVDDSIVRGSTMRKLVVLLRDAGVKEVHLRISSPPISHPCYYGIDMPTKEELIRSRFDVDGIRDFLGVDSLAYLSLDGMLACAKSPDGFCTACFSGDYPVPVGDWKGKERMDRDL